MSGIEHAMHELRSMEQLADSDQWMNRLHPLVKLCVTVGYIAAVVSVPAHDMARLCSLCVYPLVLFLAGGIPVRQAVSRLRIVLPLVCAVGIFNPVFDQRPVFAAGGFVVTSGMISMLTLMLKGCFTVLAAYLLVATTGMRGICHALRLLHVPKLIVTQILLSYRYLSVLLGEVGRMSQAYRLRAPGQKGIHPKAWGTFAGQVLLRSMDRAEALYESMCLRGYRGEFYYGSRQSLRPADLAWLLGWAGVIALFRILPVFRLVGTIFV